MTLDPPERSGDFDAVQVSTTPCWRCGLEASDDLELCPHCAAQLRTPAPAETAPRGRPASGADPLKTLMWSFALLLLTGMVHSFVLGVRFADADELDPETRQQVLMQMLVVEGLDTLVVAAVFAMCRTIPLKEPASARQRAAAWTLWLPALTLMLGVNHLYHVFLRMILHVPPLEQQVMEETGWLAFLVICVQPAIIEEVYCRGFVMGNLLTYVSRHSAVWISAVMFGLLHVASPLSIPYLIAVGVCLGYLRLASGGLLLPMLFHFVHNFTVMNWP
jgi:membrane protease YdiL (CAAX protease family)